MAAEGIKAIAEYLQKEGRVIKDAPAAYIVGVAILGGVIFAVLDWHYREEIANKDSTIQTQQARIGTLEGELKGASPQLAALEARRAASREHLLELYVAPAELTKVETPPPDLPYNGHSSDQIKALVASVDATTRNWENTTASWLEKNLGPAAKSRFLDISNMPVYSWSLSDIGNNSELTSILNRVVNERKNLAVLIETSAYDR
jgi:hypothetical protein